MMVQEMKVSLECENCGRALNWSFNYSNDTVGDDIITLVVDKCPCVSEE